MAVHYCCSRDLNSHMQQHHQNLLINNCWKGSVAIARAHARNFGEKIMATNSGADGGKRVAQPARRRYGLYFILAPGTGGITSYQHYGSQEGEGFATVAFQQPSITVG